MAVGKQSLWGVMKREAIFLENLLTLSSEITMLSQCDLMPLPLILLILQHNFIVMAARSITAS